MALFQAYLVLYIGQRSQSPEYGMAERDAAGCPAQVLNSVAFVHCVQTVLQSSVSKFSCSVQMCVCILRFQSVLAVSLSTLIAALWFCLPCRTIGK